MARYDRHYIKVKAKLEQTTSGKLKIHVWLNEFEREDFLLACGIQPKELIGIQIHNKR